MTLREDAGKSATEIRVITEIPERTERRMLHGPDRRSNRLDIREASYEIDQDTYRKQDDQDCSRPLQPTTLGMKRITLSVPIEMYPANRTIDYR